MTFNFSFWSLKDKIILSLLAFIKPQVVIKCSSPVKKEIRVDIYWEVTCVTIGSNQRQLTGQYQHWDTLAWWRRPPIPPAPSLVSDQYTGSLPPPPLVTDVPHTRLWLRLRTHHNQKTCFENNFWRCYECRYCIVKLLLAIRCILV